MKEELRRANSEGRMAGTAFAQNLRALVLTMCVSTFSLVGCRKSESPQEPKQEVPVQGMPAASAPTPTHVDIPVPADDSDRWLFVQKVSDKARGGWATGSFDADRNKLSIQTSDVEEFSLDTSRVAINWKKLVVLSIDGRNSELRKRDFDILSFTRTPHGEWIVREP